MNHRIHVIGASGTGKTTLSRRLGERLGIPVYHLDEIARTAGGRGPIRPERERARSIAEILDQPAWVTEGVHLDWTQPLLERSNLIVWLDGIPTRVARRRIIRRFVHEAVAEARRRKGRDRILRLRDYIAQLRGLVDHLRGVAAVERATLGSPLEGSRTAMARALEPYSDRVRRVSSDGDIERLIHSLSPGRAGPLGPGVGR